MTEIAFRWEVGHYEIHERGTWWYVIAALVVGGLLVYSIASKNLLFGVIIVLATITLFARQILEPKKAVCEISDKGVLLCDKFYSYGDIEAFSLVESEGGPSILYIQENRGLRSLVPIPLDGIDAEEIGEYLRDFLLQDEDHVREPIWDYLTRKLKL